MRLVRVLLLVAVFVTAPLAVSALWSAHALQDSEGFAEEMKQAWKSGGVSSEFGQTVRDATVEQVYVYFDVTGPDESFLADTAVNYAVTTIDRGLSSGAFVKAWTEWHEQLHRDLATVVQGGDPESLTVSGTTITVDATPLVEVLLSGPIGELARNALGDQAFVQTIDAGYDIEAELSSLGTLSANRWWFALGAVGCLAVLCLVWRPVRRAAAAGLFTAAAGCATAGLWRALADPSPSGVEQTVHSRAISEAFVAGWPAWLFAAAAVAAVIAVGLLATRPAKRAPTEPVEIPA